MATPAAADVSSAQRDAPDTLSPGDTTTISVTVDLTGSTDSVSILDNATGQVADVSNVTVLVDGNEVSPFQSGVTGPDNTSPFAALQSSTVSGANQVTMSYEVTATQTTGDIEIDGGVSTGSSDVDTGTDSISVTQQCLSGIAGNYDQDGDCGITITELGDAAADYSQGQISIQELGDVAAAYAST